MVSFDEEPAPPDTPEKFSIQVFANEDNARFVLSTGLTLVLTREQIECLTSVFNLLYSLGWTKRDLITDINFQMDYSSILEMRKKYGRTD